MAENQLQKGSRLERQTFMAKLRRMKKTIDQDDECSDCYERILVKLIEWGAAREKRADRKKSGL